MKTKSSILRIVLSATVLLVVCSCLHNKPDDVGLATPAKPPKVEPNLTDEAKKVAAVREAVIVEATATKAEAGTIKSETDTGKAKAPEMPQWQKIADSAVAIDKHSAAIVEQAKELAPVELTLDKAEEEVTQLEIYSKDVSESVTGLHKKIVKQQEAIDDFESGVRKRHQTIWMSVAAFSAIGLVAGIFLAAYATPKLGISLAISSAVMACVAYFMAQYALYVAIAGGVMLFLVLGYLTYYVSVNRKALLESITSFELVKHKDWNEEATKQEVSAVQSNQTKRVISEMKFKERI